MNDAEFERSTKRVLFWLKIALVTAIVGAVVNILYAILIATGVMP